MSIVSQLTSKEIICMRYKRILLVDDDEIALMVLELALEHLLPDCQTVTTQKHHGCN